jgi:hypothetical protein
MSFSAASLGPANTASGGQKTTALGFCAARPASSSATSMRNRKPLDRPALIKRKGLSSASKKLRTATKPLLPARRNKASTNISIWPRSGSSTSGLPKSADPCVVPGGANAVPSVIYDGEAAPDGSRSATRSRLLRMRLVLPSSPSREPSCRTPHRKHFSTTSELPTRSAGEYRGGGNGPDRSTKQNRIAPAARFCAR